LNRPHEGSAAVAHCVGGDDVFVNEEAQMVVHVIVAGFWSRKV
jgi:hypothetical protein